MPTITFFGGAREVTGACYRIRTNGKNFLVDCGLMQARENERDANHVPFGFNPREIDTLFVTHAHLDHIGRIPKLAREGFSGTIYSTAATRDLARLLLEDAMSVAEHEREEPLYDEQDIEKTFTLWKGIEYRAIREEHGIRFQLRDAGHILGSSMVELWVEGRHLLFTGDLGNVPSELVPPPDPADAADYLIIESTYGSRTHEAPAERELQLERAVEDIAFRKGALLIPAFATERTQDILHLLNEMLHFKRIPEMPVFVDSPLAIRITEVFEKYPLLYNQEIQKLLFEHPHLFQFRRLTFTKSVEESKAINDVLGPKVIIAGSGMMTGGRILHHAKRYLPDAKSILLIIGYQTRGSLGRRLVEKEKSVRIFKEPISVEAEIRKIGGFSAHADNPQLFSFVERLRDSLKKVFVAQGEEDQALYFMNEIRDRLGIEARAPVQGEEVEI